MMLMKQVFTRILDVLFLLIVAGTVWWIIQNRLQIRDWLFLRDFVPSPDITQLATDAGMNDNGRKLFYSGDPQLVDKATIKQVCGADIVGCIDEQDHIYILQPDKPKDEQEIIVTAAHEMLHLAYRRLNKAGRESVDPIIEQESARIGVGDLAKQAERISDDAELTDEQHSLLGTEYDDLSQELESYYNRYFSDRRKVLAAYNNSQ